MQRCPWDRLDGKKLIECPVTDGISKADQLVQRAVNGDASVYCADHPATEKEKGASGGAGTQSFIRSL